MSRKQSSICCSTACARAWRRLIWPALSFTPPPAASPISTPATTSAIGIPLCTLHLRQRRASRLAAGRVHRLDARHLRRGDEHLFDRFLNCRQCVCRPATVAEPEDLLTDFESLLNLQQQVNQAGALAAQYLVSGGCPGKLMAKMVHLLLREDRDFHTIQCIEAAFNQHSISALNRKSEPITC